MLQRHNTRERLDDAALTVLNRTGVAGMSLAAVARELGLTTPALYRHVANRAALVRRVFAAATRTFRHTVTAALDEGTEARRLWALMLLYREFAERNPGLYELLFIAPHGLSGRVYPDGFREAPADTFTFLVDRVSGAMREDAIPKDDPVDTALLLWAELHGLIMLRRSGRFAEDDFASFYDRAVTRVLAAPPALEAAEGIGVAPA